MAKDAQEQDQDLAPAVGQPAESTKKTNWLWNAAKLAAAILLVLVVYNQTDVSQLVALRDRISFGWLGGYFLVFCLLAIIKAFQYWALFDRRIPYRSMLRTVVWQNSLSNLVATGAGIASYLAMLKAEQGIKLRKSGVVFLVTKVGEVLMVGVYLALSAWWSWPQIENLRLLVLLLLFGIAGGVSMFLIAVFWREQFITLAQSFATKLRLDKISLVDKLLHSLRALANADQREIVGMLVKGFAISFLYVSVTNVLIVISLRVFSLDVGLWPVVFVSSFLQLFANIPIQVLGGLGVSEVTSVYLYGLFGIDPAQMAAVQLGIRAVFYLSNAALLLYLLIDRFLPGDAGSQGADAPQ